MPILKPKEAEMNALTEIGLADLELVPLIDLHGARPRVAERPGKPGAPNVPGKPAQLMSDHLDQVYKRLEPAQSGKVLMDPHMFLHRHPQGLATLMTYWEQWRVDAVPLRIAPVFRIGQRLSVTEAMADFARLSGLGGGLRLLPNDLAMSELRQEIESLLKLGNLRADSMDLIIDARCLVNVDRDRLAGECVKVINDLASLSFASVTLAATGYLENPRQDDGRVDRLERTFWANVQERVGITVNFGDYGVDAPTEPMDPDYVQVKPLLPVTAVRYTLDEQWLFLKEAASVATDSDGSTKTRRGDFRIVCQRLINSGEFYGAQFSPGDQYFEDMALGKFDTAGVSTRWRQAMYSHHFAVVLDQFSEDDPEASDADSELPF